MRFVEGIRNLVTTPAKGNERQSRLGVVPTADQMQTDMVWRLLTEQIEHGWDESLPKPAPNPDDLYGPTLIGAWAEDRLVGGAFVMPDSVVGGGRGSAGLRTKLLHDPRDRRQSRAQA